MYIVLFDCFVFVWVWFGAVVYGVVVVMGNLVVGAKLFGDVFDYMCVFVLIIM